MIKNLVLSACGPNLVTMIGVLHELYEQNYWNLDNIECFYGSSGGTIITVFLLLSDDFNMLKDYIIKRPWDKVWPIDANAVFSMYENLGIFSIDDFYKGFEPFFKAKNIDKNITLKEFYELTKKPIYIYIAELNNFEGFHVNYKTHPEMKLLEAIYKSSSVPGIFIPILEDNKCYIDGGLLNYFPTGEALKKSDKSTILGLCNNRSGKCNTITSKSNIIDFLTTLLFKNMDFVIDSIFKTDNLENIIYVPGFNDNNLWLEIINSKNKREEMYNLGIQTAQKFLSNHSSKTEEEKTEEKETEEIKTEEKETKKKETEEKKTEEKEIET